MGWLEGAALLSWPFEREPFCSAAKNAFRTLFILQVCPLERNMRAARSPNAQCRLSTCYTPDFLPYSRAADGYMATNTIITPSETCPGFVNHVSQGEGEGNNT